MRNESSLKVSVRHANKRRCQTHNGRAQKNLLLVDDTPANLRVATSLLDDSYEIRIATNGAMALELMKIHPVPDLILLDIMMPGMNGYEDRVTPVSGFWRWPQPSPVHSLVLVLQGPC